MIGVAVLGALITAGPSAYFANEANQNASNAAEDAKSADVLASSAFSIANNFPASIILRGYTPVGLRPVNCVPISPSTVLCGLNGGFNLNFSIIAPHSGRYNVYKYLLTTLSASGRVARIRKSNITM